MRKRVALLYGIGLTVILHVAILVVLNTNLIGSDGLAAELERRAAAPLGPGTTRNPGAQRNIHLAHEQEQVVQARQLLNASHAPWAEHNKSKISTSKIRVAHPSTSIAGAARSGGVGNASEGGGGKKSRPSDKNVTMSSERQRRLNPPSMLLDGKNEGDKKRLYAEAKRHASRMKERRRRDALAELEGGEVVLGKQAVVKQLMDAASNDRKAGNRTAGRQRKVAKKSKSDEMKAYVIDALAEERKKAEQMNKIWKESRDKKEKPKTLDHFTVNGAKRATVEQYFEHVCEDPPGPLVECLKTPPRKLSEFEASGGDILLSIRTTLKYHDTRLPVLFDTWLGEVEPTSVFIVTDGEDEDLIWKTNTLG
jgi:hypothetical protein